MSNKKIDLTFSGAGFMGCYYFGVVACWNKYIPRDRVNRVAGASAGSLIAAYYLLDLPLDKCLREIITMTEQIRGRIGGVFNRETQVVDELPVILDKLFPEDAHKIVSGRLHVCMTRRKDFKKVIVNHFDTRKDLIDALNCSCFIPVWSGNHCSTYKSEKYIDGGFVDNLPVFDEHTIRVCCFAGPTEISPYDRSTMTMMSGKVQNMPIYFNFLNLARGRRALFPPPADYILKLIETGYRDTKHFILKSDLIKCDKCYQRLGCLGPDMISPSISPALSRAPSMCSLSDKIIYQPSKHHTAFRGMTDEELEKGLSKLTVATCRASSPKSQLETTAKNLLAPLFKSPSNNKQVVPKEVPEIEFEIIADEEKTAPDHTTNASIINEVIITTTEYDEQQQVLEKQCDDDNNGYDNINSNNNNLIVVTADSNDAKKTSFNLSDQLTLPEKFTRAPNSCPPSPQLNRHCAECIRMRHEARLDTMEEDDLMQEIQCYLPPHEAHSDNFGAKLLAPFRWIRSLGTKSSYKLVTVEPVVS
ncbi:Patatin-like phospholipase domain-containing protein 2 [Fragariocoptes setiger]|uniref:Patatin-like phospholipase domain-containing protein 2 n=1 Tax=Fragariocoptes setiger TaxID=1670756 RepID=A0ABQ7S714_9ACAR|nr:Patatin-like phospholipase domain-containing protein 2 [Fragariocoptes setiger]